MITGWFEPETSYALFDDFRRRFEQLFDEVDHGRPLNRPRVGAWPRANLYDAGENLVIEAELPGVAKEDLAISGSLEILTISGERKVEAPANYSVHRQERLPLKFARTFRFPVRVDVDHASAEFKNGVLTVQIPKAPEVKPRSITVKVS